jgi:hypothetical protein
MCPWKLVQHWFDRYGVEWTDPVSSNGFSRGIRAQRGSYVHQLF